MRSLTTLSILLLAGTVPASAWAKGPAIQYSEPMNLGDGQVQVFAMVAGDKPMHLGVVMDADIFSNAPTEESDGMWDVVDAEGNVVWHCCGHELDFDVPANMQAASAFTHIVVNWNPVGHPPPTVYTVPHLDFHFYTMSREDRYAITAPAAEDMCNDNIYGLPAPVPVDCDELDLAMMPLPADMMPPQHSNLGAVEPGMGNHLIDLSSPEFNGSPFTHTFIFGTWAGELTFWEPMITQEFLESHPRVLVDIPIPAAAPEAGYYPTRYGIFYLPRKKGQYIVMLTDFVWLPQSSGE